MREQFPDKKVGDPWPTAKHINDLSSVFGRLGRFSGGTNQFTRHAGSFLSVASTPPWTQHIVIVSNLQIDANDTDNSGLYLVKLRWYSNNDSEWKTNDDKEYELDSSDFNRGLVVDDKLVAFWDQQRGMFIPASTGRGRYFELD